VFRGEFACLGDHAGAACFAGGKDNFGTEKAHEFAALDAEGLRHDDDERVAFLRADHGKADAGVAAAGLNDGLAGLEKAALLRILNDAEGETVFDGAERVEGLDLDVEVDVRGSELVDADDGCVADGFEDAGELVSMGAPSEVLLQGAGVIE